MEKFKHLKIEVLEQLNFLLTTQQFRQGVGHSMHIFQRDVAAGHQSLSISFNEKSDLVIDPYISMCHIALENLIQDINRHPGTINKLPQGIACIGNELGNVAQGRYMWWRVGNADDVSRACSEIVDVFRRSGVPYLERFRSLEEILAATTLPPSEAWLYSPIPTTRVQTAIATAFLLGRRNLFVQLVDELTEYLKEIGWEGRPLRSFLLLAEILDKRWPLAGV